MPCYGAPHKNGLMRNLASLYPVDGCEPSPDGVLEVARVVVVPEGGEGEGEEPRGDVHRQDPRHPAVVEPPRVERLLV